ncbi:MAG: sensor histidine kinase [Vallitalea sp.]|jgi:two-component system sensor histidine kinase YesM|nr:sensor histidine kinase [Vallitalea sp.]
MKNRKKILLDKFGNIRTTMTVLFSLIIILALLIFLLIALQYTENTVLDNSLNYVGQIIEQVNYDIDSYIEYMENIADIMVDDKDLQSYLYVINQPKNFKVDKRVNVVTQFKTVLESREDIYNIGAYSADGNHIINDGMTHFNEYLDIAQQSWYREAIESPTGEALSASHVQNAIKNNYKWVITLSKVIVNQRTGEKSGVFFIDLNYSIISNLCNKNRLGNKSYIFIIDKDGDIIYHPKQQLIYGGIKKENIQEILNSDGEDIIINKGNDKLHYTYRKSDKTGWIIVGVIFQSELLKNSRQTKILYIIVSIFLIIGVILVSRRLSIGITRPIQRLRDSMVKVEKGEFKQANIDIIANNEVGILTHSFNNMTNKIDELMQEIVYEQEEKRKLEMRALQSQINPHFLYNTLDSIIWMAEGNKNREVVQMTASLAKLMRQSISNEAQLISIKQEMEYIQSYLTIQKMRYRDKLEFNIEVEEQIKQASIIKLLLQPIVENAIYHGLKYKEDKGNLNIRGYRDKDNIIIEVIDDGVGMSEDKVCNIFEEHKVNYNLNGVGIYNVMSRIKLYYGEEYGITYYSTKGFGTIVKIKIPFSK